MSIDELIEHRESAANSLDAEQSSLWYTFASWPPSRDCVSRLMVALHRTTGECHIDWAEIERTAVDVTDQARHLAQALLAIRDRGLAPVQGRDGGLRTGQRPCLRDSLRLRGNLDAQSYDCRR
jgi:hypothetical protein